MARVNSAERILLICESPNKVKTLKQFLPDNYIVMASVGHISRIANSGEKNLGINLKSGKFEEDYEIDSAKKEVVSKLKEQAKFASKIVLASDPDREGEAIAWFLYKFLELGKLNKPVERITYHEITKKAVEEALANPRKIDENYVNAARVRSDEDKIVGWYPSEVSRMKGKGRSVGNVQSPALRLVVDREEEIENFKSEIYFDFYLNFIKNKIPFKAKYQSETKLTSLDQCQAISNECKDTPYVIEKVTKKDSKENPKPPFVTNTFLQEVSSKLGLSAEQGMSCAQKLFEGIDINHTHVALITYHRTDDATYAPEFVTELKQFIKNTYGDEYCGELKSGKKSENAQAGHEGIRVIDLTMTPEKVAEHINNDLLIKVYTIIYRRTLASCMKPAIIANTIYDIKNGNHYFQMNSKELRFDGYRKAYSYKDDEKDDDSQIIKETFKKGEILTETELEAIEKHTNPPKRYNEASLIKELDKLGIGRPSTFATTISNILSEERGYAKIVNKEIVPTQLGMEHIHWLKQDFPQIVDLSNRSNMEKELDLIAQGKRSRIEALTHFWKSLKEQYDKAMPDSQDKKTCPNCGKGMVIRKGRYGYFWACTGYPNCQTIESIKNKKT